MIVLVVTSYNSRFPLYGLRSLDYASLLSLMLLMGVTCISAFVNAVILIKRIILFIVLGWLVNGRLF